MCKLKLKEKKEKIKKIKYLQVFKILFYSNDTNDCKLNLSKDEALLE